jgi:hypothetical protein
LGGKKGYMKKVIIAILATTPIFMSSPGLAAEKVCWPLHFAGVTLGITTDLQVSRLLGKGIFRKSDGDTGGRVFVDKARTATLHTVSYTDFVVGEVTVSAGVPKLSEKQLSKAETKFFDPQEGFGNWHALKLGSTEVEVRKNLGEPSEKDDKGGWVYYTSCACETPEYFTIYFTKGRITKVVFSAPAG